ncbi:MAG: hypothetical protein HQ581_16330 [Planctomycetes bacterium]|nr:hypothetical protein [Planctomycetota bacterium]
MTRPQSLPPDAPVGGQSAGEIHETLRRRIACLQEARLRNDRKTSSSGCGALDQLLPRRGFCRGTLTEWLAAGWGHGAETLAFQAAGHACREGEALVVLDARRRFYPPGAAWLGIAPEQLIVVRAAGQSDHTWAADQSLRCPGVGAVVVWPEKLDGRTFRRMQLAAEEGGSLGFLIRPQRVQREPSWADVRLLIEPLPPAAYAAGRRLKIRLLRCRGAADDRCLEVEIDDETHAVYPLAQLAHRTTPRRATGA